jgi:alkanesulfonate monooxygenase SsuD/methylene tetrahydromethanopterin reductase-like flavin-dependent oxidoreductase (luciferase family)
MDGKLAHGALPVFLIDMNQFSPFDLRLATRLVRAFKARPPCAIVAQSVGRQRREKDVLAPSPPARDRRSMHNNNTLKIGLFGANCSSGRAVTLVPERWSGSWADNLKLARMADEAGIDFMLPIGRWKGYGGDTDYQGATLETITWATGLLASTQRITVFGTVHAPLFHPVIAAKEMVTADHVGAGRFGLNIVVGWNEGEFEMFGVKQRDHEQRYEYAQEWLDVIKLIWSDKEDFDYDGKYLHMKKVRGKPKPYGGTQPVIMNAGASPVGQAFAIRNCDAFFLQASRTSLAETADKVAQAKSQARAHGRELGVYTVGVVTCRPTKKEAEDYFRYSIMERADWSAVDSILALKNITKDNTEPKKFQEIRDGYAQGMGGLPMIGDPDQVASALADLSKAGLTGIAISFVNYVDELPFFCDEVLPRLERIGLREKR